MTACGSLFLRREPQEKLTTAGNHREPQGTTGNHREPQGTTGNHREPQGIAVVSFGNRGRNVVPALQGATHQRVPPRREGDRFEEKGNRFQENM